MCASSMTCRLASRLLCGILLVVALLDVPVVGWPETGRLVGVLCLLGLLAGIALLLRRRGQPEAPLDHTALPERSVRTIGGHWIADASEPEGPGARSPGVAALVNVQVLRCQGNLDMTVVK